MCEFRYVANSETNETWHNFCSKIPGYTETGGVGDDYCKFILGVRDRISIGASGQETLFCYRNWALH